MGARCPDLEAVDWVFLHVKLLIRACVKYRSPALENGLEEAVLEELRCGR